AGLACDRRRIRPARGHPGRPVVRAAGVADLLGASLGVAAPADDLATARTAARAAGCAGARLGLAGTDPGRGAVAAELRAADDLGDTAAGGSGLRRAGPPRRAAGDS